MQSNRHYRGEQSHLINSMHSYLINQNRVQPIIGLGSITELCTDAEPPVYLCDVCFLRINKTDIKTHIMGSLHRHNYIRCHHGPGLNADVDLTHLAWHLMELAKLIEKKEGTGNVQVLHLDKASYKEMISHSVVDALAQVEEINMRVLKSPDCEKPTEGDCFQSSSNLSMPQFKGLRSYVIQDLQEEQSVQCWTPMNIVSPEDNITIQSPVRTVIEMGTPSPPGYPSLSEYQTVTPMLSQSGPISPGTIRKFRKRSSPIQAPEQNGSIHVKKAKNQRRFINPVDGVGTDLYLSKVQTKKYKSKPIDLSQNSSLTVTITQHLDEEIIKCEEISQEISQALKTIRTQGLLTPAVTQDENRSLDDQYGGTNDAVENSFVFEGTTYSVTTDNYQEPQDDSSGSQSLGHFMESPESYSGTQPLIGLQVVIKCESVDGVPAPCCYLCQACSLKVFKNVIIEHLISPQHYFNYINFQHPHLSMNIKSECYNELYITAIHLEQEEGRGQMEVTRLSACLFNEILERDYHWCIKMLNCGFTNKVKPKREPPMESSHMTSGYSITPKSPKEVNVDHTDSGIPPVLVTQRPHSQSKRAKKKRTLNKAGYKEPVFKVSLPLKQGSVVLDRTLLVTPTVAPEIEYQYPADLNAENNTLPKEPVTSEVHFVTPEATYKSPKTFQNPEQYSSEHVHQEEPVGYTERVARTYGCVNNSQISDTHMSHLNTNQEPYCSSLGIVNNNSFIEETSFSNYSMDRLTSVNSWTFEEQFKNYAHDWPMERHQVTQSASNWPVVSPFYVPVAATDIRHGEHRYNQGMFAEGNYGTMHSPTRVDPGATANYFPASNLQVSHSAQYMSQRWLCRGFNKHSDFSGF